MKKVHSMQRYQTERAIIDALLKISEIMKKATSMKSGDGDKTAQRNEYDVPIPPSMRTFKSEFNKRSSSILRWNSRRSTYHRKKYQYRTSFVNDEYSTSDC